MHAKKQPLDLAPDWTAARGYHSASIHHARLTVAAMVLLGWKLHGIKKQLGFMGSGRRKKVESDSTLTWEQWLEQEIPGLSRRVADNRIATYDACKRRLKTMGETKAVALLEGGCQTGKDQELLEKLVHKATDGETVKSLFQDAGIAKLPQGGTATGGNLGGGSDESDDDDHTAEQLAFAFFSDPISKLVECRLHKDYSHFLAVMPVTGNAEENKPGLVDLKHHLQCMLDEIEDTLKTRKQAALTK